MSTEVTTPPASAPAASNRVPPQASGSAPWVVIVGYPREALAGQYLEGPRDPKRVKRNGYGFTKLPKEAWPFASERAAKAKARIIERHMGWGEGVAIVEQLCVNDTDGDGDCHLCARNGGCPLRNT